MQHAENLSAQRTHIVQTIFDADGAMDADLFVSVLAERATMRVAGGSLVEGRDHIRSMVVELFAGFSSISHALVRAHDRADYLIYEAEVTYGLKDGRLLVLPYANILRFVGDLIDDYRIYIDLSPLQGPPA
jgi:ketosteroid isomerase-like protein